MGAIRAAMAGMERTEILERIWTAKEEKRRRRLPAGAPRLGTCGLTGARTRDKSPFPRPIKAVSMATDRRKFLALMALGLPATTTAMRQSSPPIIRDGKGEREGPAIKIDLFSVLKERLWDLSMDDDASIRVIRRAPSDCPPGKIRWAIEIEEADASSKSIMDRHPRVLLVYSKSLRALYSICLEQAGCRVDSAPDNDAAMLMYREHGPYDVVLTHIFDFRDLSKRIRERNPKQAFAIVGSCGATGIRFDHKIPVLREGGMQQGIRQTQLVRLVESAIKPKVKILLVVGYSAHEYRALAFGKTPDPLLGPKSVKPYELWHLGTSHPESFEIELESNGRDAFRRYCEHGPYDMALIDFRLPGLAGDDLALAIRKENSAQRITMLMHSGFVGSSIRRKLGDIPILNLEQAYKARKKEQTRYPSAFFDRRDGEHLLGWVEDGVRLTSKKPAKSRA